MGTIGHGGGFPPETRAGARHARRHSRERLAGALTALALGMTLTHSAVALAQTQASGSAAQSAVVRQNTASESAQPSSGADQAAARTGASSAAGSSAESVHSIAGEQAPPKKDAVVRFDWIGLVTAGFMGLARLIAILAAGFATMYLAKAALAMFTDMPKDQADSFSFRRHWGGFGGASSSGWYVSPSLIRLVVAAGLAITAALIGLAALEIAFAPTSKSEGAASGSSEASGASAVRVAPK